MRRISLAIAATVLACPALAWATPEAPAPAAPAATFDVTAAKARISAVLDKNYAHLDALYKDIHQHPELAFHEVRTAEILASEMRKLGFDVTEHVGGTGIVALYRNGAGPVVLVRTELDALPVLEKTGLAYASHAEQPYDGKLTPVAHACGHDAHMAWWVGAAEALLAMKEQWHGTLMFIGQPAEETVSGAKAMLDDGLFARFPRPNYGFAAHVAPMSFDTVVLKDGTAMAASDSVDVVFNGRGGHGSVPSATIDPVVMGAHFVTDVQTVISRQKPADAFGVVTVGSFQAGTVDNIIPDKVELKLTLRSTTPEVRKLLNDGVVATAKAVSDMAGAPAPTITHVSGTDALRNDSAMVARETPVMQAAFGKAMMVLPANVPVGGGSEDYAAFVDAGVPSAYFWVGGDNPKMLVDDKARGIPVPMNHSPYFAPVPEPTIRTGATVLALAVLSVTAVQTER